MGFFLRFLIWGLFRMARPDQIVAVFVVSLTGMLIATPAMDIMGLLNLISDHTFTFLILILSAMSIHYANEYADVDTDAMTQRTQFSGGSGAIAMGWVTPTMAYIAMWFTGILSMLLAFIGLILQIILPIKFLILCVGLFGGWMYSLKPLKLAWRGWGELDNALLGGALLLFYGYSAVTGSIDVYIIWIAIPFTILVFLNLLATTWADKEADGMVGKNTLAVQYDVIFLRRLFGGMRLAFVVMTVLVSFSLPQPILFLALMIPVFIMVGWGFRTYTKIHSPHPTVLAMIVMMSVQLLYWLFI